MAQGEDATGYLVAFIEAFLGVGIVLLALQEGDIFASAVQLPAICFEADISTADVGIGSPTASTALAIAI
ncbi:hypothetical protein R6Q57_025501 [Mikania cordata]